MHQIEAKLLYNEKIRANYLHCAFYAPLIAKEAQPGQFVDIRMAQAAEPLLRRPFSIHRVNGPRIELIYEVVGSGTQILSQKRAGEYLDVIGPLGNGFDYVSCVMYHVPCVLVAGGMGVAPLIFLAEKLRERKTHNAKCKTLVLIGAKTKSQILCEREFRELGCEVKIATDNGSKGCKGKVTDLLKTLLPTTYYLLPTMLYACGPKPMLKEISGIAKEYNLPAQISLEAHMACGFGACLGCTINTREGYKRVCKDGPVFRADEINWTEGSFAK